MRIGVPKEVKTGEYRIATTPSCIKTLKKDGHTIIVQKGAGVAAGFTDAQLKRAGAKISSQKDVWACDMVVKVKEPQPAEYKRMHKNLILFSYLHLAGAPKKLTKNLCKRGVSAFAMGTVQDKHGRAVLTFPMSTLAGRMSVQVGCHYLSKEHGGHGVLVDDIPGAPPAKVVVIGAGAAGSFAALAAAHRGADVKVFDIRADRVTALAKQSKHITGFKTNKTQLTKALKEADLVVGAAWVPGARTPHVVSKKMIKAMKEGSVVVDIAIDQGGCFETSKPTSHKKPVYVKHGVTHYCVPNMPGAYPQTATVALTAATLPFIRRLARQGVAKAVRKKDLAGGLNVYKGRIVYPAVARDLHLQKLFTPLSELL